MSAIWSAGQQKLLSAMGYALYARPGVGAAVETVAGKAESSGITVAAPPVSNTKEAGASRLLASLHRFAGDADLAALVPDVTKLRRDPQLKRALWPKLRALRRPH